MPSPTDRRYTKEHEWVAIEDGVGVVGITEFAQEQLGDVVYVDLPEEGTQVRQFEKFGEIESVKAVSELYSPVTGEVIERNQAVIDEPELVNRAPYGEGWLIKVRLTDPAELENLLEAAQYDEMIAQAEEPE